MSRKPADDIPTVAAQIAGLTIYVTCECRSREHHVVECEEDDFGIWSAMLPERFILCDACNQLIDAGLRITVRPPE